MRPRAPVVLVVVVLGVAGCAAADPSPAPASAPDTLLSPARRPAALVEPRPTGRTPVSPPSHTMRRQRPDGSWITLVRIPGGPVERHGARRAVPTFWLELEAATVRSYAPFLRAHVAAGGALEDYLPLGESDLGLMQRDLLRLAARQPAEDDAHLPDEVLLPVPSRAATAYLAWAGLSVLDELCWARAREVAGPQPVGLRGGWFPE